ncbi:MAG: divergent polysaccharide deacetylase family protein [Gammaproteobacteria bacterium]|nr:divergent polysaccharide deacetylase family protein [Gammaproteobacteria bacterium]
MIAPRYLLFAILLATLPQALAGTTPRIAIIIDDLGYELQAGRRAIELPGPLAYAILPGTPRARLLAEAAHRRGKEVLLHLPLQAVEHPHRAEPGGITLDMSQASLRDAFTAALESVPFVIGVSSHRGSLLTRHPGHMSWLMQEIRARNDLFFIDSFTTHKSVALQIAREAGVVATKRDVFLDTDPSPEALAREFERLKSVARQHGIAVGIGHPYPETLDFLERELRILDSDEFELVPISKALERSFEPAVAGRL